MIHAVAIVALLALSSPIRVRAADEPVPDEPLRAELVAEHTALVPGRPQSFGVRLSHRPHWHSYWVNPGDSGLPTVLEWSLPPGVSAGEVEWPVPRRFEVGGLTNIGYEGETLLPVTITLPADAAVGSSVYVGLVVKWLACREECIPGKASLSIELPVVRETPVADARWTRAFASARLSQPQATAWSGSARGEGERIVVRLRGAGLPPASAPLDAFVAQRRVFDNRPPTIRRDRDELVIDAARSEYAGDAPGTIDLVVATPGVDAPRGWHVRVPYARGTPPAP